MPRPGVTHRLPAAWLPCFVPAESSGSCFLTLIVMGRRPSIPSRSSRRTPGTASRSRRWGPLASKMRRQPTRRGASACCRPMTGAERPGWSGWPAPRPTRRATG